MTHGYQIIRDGPDSFSIEGFFNSGGEQRFISANGFKTEAEARKWVYNQQANEGGSPLWHPHLGSFRWPQSNQPYRSTE
jgi:hypothetical protein